MQPNKYYICEKQNQETKAVAKKLKINDFYPELFYASKLPSLKKLCAKLKNNDIIEIHMEGNPYEIGDYTEYTPKKLADSFKECDLNPNLNLTIDLRCCNSGVAVMSDDKIFCFARDFSECMYNLGYKQITVFGYTGYIQFKKMKESVVGGSGAPHGSKVPHCTMDDARNIYRNGFLTVPALKKLITDYLDEDKIVSQDTAQVQLRSVSPVIFLSGSKRVEKQQYQLSSELHRLKLSP